MGSEMCIRDRKYSGSDVKWIEDPLDAAAELETILKNTKQSDLDLFKTLALLKAALLGGKFEAEFKTLDNDLVGVRLLSDDEFEKIFATAFQPGQMVAQEDLQANVEGIQGEA